MSIAAVVGGVTRSRARSTVRLCSGPKGCGKSTLLRALARRLAILPQGPVAPEGLSVEELVWFGRHPHQGRFALRREEDRAAVNWALDQTGMRIFAGRPLDAPCRVGSASGPGSP